MIRPLIPRQKLFGNPSALGAKLSPDGAWLSWLAPFEEVMNVWLAPPGNLAAAEPLTRTKGRPIEWQDWTPDGKFVMFMNDETGDENWHVFAADRRTRELKDLTPIKGVNAQVNQSSRLVPDKIAVGLNDRDERWHDLYLVDPATAERTLLFENASNYMGIGLDWQLRPRHARSSAPEGGSILWRLEDGRAVEWLRVPYGDDTSTWPMFFDVAGERLLMRSSIGRDTAGLVSIDWSTGTETVVVEHPRYDVQNAIVHPTTFALQAASVTGAREEWVYMTPEVAPDLALLRERLAGFDFEVSSQTDDGRRWIVLAHKPEQPATFFLFDRDAQTVTELLRARPALKPYRLAPMQAIETKSRDGLDLVSYLTLPAGVEGPRPPKPLPMVLTVHGGPWGRDGYGYNREHQWLADRGYAALSVNYRGSTGFGKAFVAAAEKQHAAKMHDDLIDMVDWAVGEGIADPEKVAIMGGSYGGYAAFVGATFTPEVFCCAVPVVGISNLQTLLETMPPYWAGFAEFMYRSYGDPRTEEGRALLAERSPLTRVDRIVKPMLIFHGANDVRCKIAESDQIVAAMKARNIPVAYVVYPDEGHGFHKPENRLAHYAIAEAFLARHLGGAVEPVGEDFKGSSHEVREGAELVTSA